MGMLHHEPGTHPVGMLHPRSGTHSVHTVHRVSAAAVGGFLTVFGVLGLAYGLPFFSTVGATVLGMSSNGSLATLSVIVGGILLASAARGGHIASNISVTFGVLFLLSGVANAIVLGTSLNVLAFRPPNIVFSLMVGAALLITGAYGRITGGLPLDNPYHRNVPDDISVLTHEEAGERARDLASAPELAEAERASALHYATPQQIKRLAIVRMYRSGEDRQRAWRVSATEADTD
jgi:hypothetical protein